MLKRTFITFAIIPILVFGVFLVLRIVFAVGTPTSLSVTPLSSCALQVNWIQPPPVGTRYDARRDGLVQTDVSVVNSGGNQYYFVDRNQYLWPPLDPNTTHAYSIQAYDALTGEASGFVGPVSGVTNSLPPAPGAPQDITSVAKDGGTVDVNWTSGAVSSLFNTYGGFLVERAVSSDGGSNFGAFSQRSRIPAGVNFYSDPVWNDAGYRLNFYKYRIIAQEVGGEGCDFNRSVHTVLSSPSPEVVTPASPTSLRGNFVSSPSRQINLEWNYSSANITRFELWRSLGSSFNPANAYLVESNISAASRAYSDASIEPTGVQVYTYRIRSCTATACSFFSQEFSVATGVLAPMNLNAGIAGIRTDLNTGDLSLKWEGDVLAGSTYFIERATSSRVFREIIQVSAVQVAQSNNTYLDSNLPLQEEYFYRVRIRSAGGVFSDYSNEASANLKILYLVKGVAWSAFFGPPPPDTISPTVSITAPADSAGVSDSITISASASDNVGVASVQFRVDDVNIGPPITTPPYSAIWDSRDVPDGSHIISAVALDAALNLGSASITVRVANTLPLRPCLKEPCPE